MRENDFSFPYFYSYGKLMELCYFRMDYIFFTPRLALQLPSREISKAKQAIADLSVVGKTKELMIFSLIYFQSMTIYDNNNNFYSVKYSDLKFKDIIVRQLFEFSKEAQVNNTAVILILISFKKKYSIISR